MKYFCKPRYIHFDRISFPVKNTNGVYELSCHTLYMYAMSLAKPKSIHVQQNDSKKYLHYENTTMQYTETFQVVKNGNFSEDNFW